MAKNSQTPSLAFTLQLTRAGGFVLTALKNLRTEIVLRDANDVAFWFSFSFRFATLRQQKAGKRSLLATHQIQASPKALFPKKRECGEKDKLGGG